MARTMTAIAELKLGIYAAEAVDAGFMNCAKKCARARLAAFLRPDYAPGYGLHINNIYGKSLGELLAGGLGRLTRL